jgi:hypothetical protein
MNLKSIVNKYWKQVAIPVAVYAGLQTGLWAYQKTHLENQMDKQGRPNAVYIAATFVNNHENKFMYIADLGRTIASDNFFEKYDAKGTCLLPRNFSQKDTAKSVQSSFP